MFCKSFTDRNMTYPYSRQTLTVHHSTAPEMLFEPRIPEMNNIINSFSVTIPVNFPIFCIGKR